MDPFKDPNWMKMDNEKASELFTKLFGRKEKDPYEYDSGEDNHEPLFPRFSNSKFKELRKKPKVETKTKDWNKIVQEAKVLIKEAEDEFLGFPDKEKLNFVAIDAEGKYSRVEDPTMKLPPKNN